MNRFRGFVSDCKRVSPAVKYICKLGCILTLSLFCGAVTAFLLADKVGDYYRLMQLSQDFITVLRPCVGILGIFAIVFQAATPVQAES